MLKIALKTKNEGMLLDYWLQYHSRIVGWENIFVFDNTSSDEDTLRIYEKYSSVLKLIQWSDDPLKLHNPSRCPGIYQSIIDNDDCYLILLDTDEFLTYYDVESGNFDSSLVYKKIKTKVNLAINTLWINATPRKEDLIDFRNQIYFENNEAKVEENRRLGKTILSSKHKAFSDNPPTDSNIGHSYLNPEGVFEDNFCVLHCPRADIQRRILNNVSIIKYRAYLNGVIELHELDDLHTQLKQGNVDEKLKNSLLPRMHAIMLKKPHHKLQEVIDYLQNKNKFLSKASSFDTRNYIKTNVIQQVLFGDSITQEISLAGKKYANLLELSFYDFLVNSGKPVKILYHSTIPEDFDAAGYKLYNPDLSNFNDEQLRNHYKYHGRAEERVYRIDIPEDFDVDAYRNLNVDIFDQTDAWLKAHYFRAGKAEGRKYIDPFFDKQFFCAYNNIKTEEYTGYRDYLKDIRQVKSQTIFERMADIPLLEDHILLVSHDSSIYGATHYLYLIFHELKALGKKVKVVEMHHNEALFKKYGLVEDDVMFYYNDPTLLYYMCTKSNPKKVYFNSMNSCMATVAAYIPREKLLIHSHEVRKHYICETLPDFVVSARISGEYDNSAKVQPPIIDARTLASMDEEFNKDVELCNAYGPIDRSKIAIGMCGSLCDRKNWKTFLSAAEKLSGFNFIWVGGSFDIGEDLLNFYHVKNVSLPYKYYRLFDYFLLTSLEDPCPYVVLENLYVGNRVLTFKENIYTSHGCENLREVYFEKDGEVSLNSVLEHIFQTCTEKALYPRPEAGKKYVLAGYTKLREELKQALV